MPLFKRNPSRKVMNAEPVPIQRSNTQRKEHAHDVHDPVLTAIHDAQPFEESMTQSNHYRTVSSPETRFRDIFGNVIAVPDRSNPTRQRDERPLDTIRTFEYACTGDERIREEMETPRLGWTMRQNFHSMPQFDHNPYQTQAGQGQQQSGGNVISFDQGNSSGNMNSNYMRQEPPAPPKKKKRGLFGKKKD